MQRERSSATTASTNDNGVRGQRAIAQINTLELLEALGCSVAVPWRARNGNVRVGPGGASHGAALDSTIAARGAELLALIAVGVHARVGVTFALRWSRRPADVRVTQVYCDAVPLGMYCERNVPMAA